MADKDDDGPSLELPSLGFGRKRGKKARGAAEDASVAPEPAPPAAEPEPTAPEPTAPEPTADPAPAAAPREQAPPEPPAPPLFADEVQDSPTRVDAPPVADEPTVVAEPVVVDEPAKPSKPAKPKRQFQLPAISSMTAALLSGAVVGALMVGLTGAGFQVCEVVQGTSSCGDPGILLLLAIVIVSIVVGKALLAGWDLPDPGSTSFLAVGLLCVVALLFLVDVLFNWWMIIVIPIVGAASFALSHWVTTAFVEDE